MIRPKAEALIVWLLRLASLAPLYFLFRMVFSVTIFPMELEVREGNSWLQVLVQKAGISIYDHSQVAITSMAYGPLDPLLKFAIAQLVPSLPSQVVTRAFVSLLFPALLAMTYLSFRKWPRLGFVQAALCASAIYVSLINLGLYNALVGRPDALACWLLVVQAAWTTHLILNGRPVKVWAFAVYSLLPVAVFFSNIRYIPAAGAFWLIATVVSSEGKWKKGAVLSLSSLLVFGLFFAALLWFVLDGDAEQFYRHFYGVFLESSSGVITPPDTAFELFPSHLLSSLATMVPLYGMALAALALLAFFKQPQVSKPMRWMCGGLVLLAYFTLAVLYQHNKNGGGLYYFAPFLLLVWWIVTVLLSHPSVLQEWILVAISAAYLIFIPQWSQVVFQTRNVEAAHDSAAQFRNALTQLYDRGELMSEDLQLFKTSMGRSLIDNGDSAALFMKSAYFDEQFMKTTQKFYGWVFSGEFHYYLSAGIENPATRTYLEQNYNVVAVGPSYVTWNGQGGCVSPINCVRLLMKK